jgi:hypothetical protein
MILVSYFRYDGTIQASILDSFRLVAVALRIARRAAALICPDGGDWRALGPSGAGDMQKCLAWDQGRAVR